MKILAVNRRTLLVGVAGAAASTVLGRPAFAQKAGGEAIVAQQAAPATLDAMTTSLQAARNISMHIFETLYTRGESGSVISALASDCTASPAFDSFTFHLRQGVPFHNGKEMTSADVKASLERYQKVGGSAQILKSVSSIEAPDKYTIVVKLNQAVPGFLSFISSPRAPMVVMPAEEAAKEVNKAALIGTGPYQFVEYRPDSHVLLKRFANYAADDRFAGPDGFGGKKTAYLEAIRFRFMPESSARAAALQAGEVHALEQLATTDAKRLKSNASVNLYEMTPWAIQTFFLNANEAPTNNVKFRQAVLAALGTEEIMAIATDNLYRLVPSWQYPGSDYFTEEQDPNLYNVNNADRAHSLLKEAGYKGEPFTLLTDNSYKNDNDASVIASQHLQAVGINVKLQVADWPTVVAARTKPTGWNMFPIFIGVEPWEGPFSTTTFFTGQNNWQMKQDPVLDALSVKLSTAPTKEAQKQAFAEFQHHLMEQAYAINLGELGIYQATRANLTGYRPFRIPRMWDVSFT
ncbi:ABC transporter substrate-binding protein [Bradyrhizobium sp. AZCC 2230]|uniref:ABC transporter substrate-binding protein n=1 Tax=Bradyrhizobium sp. AZCC 2230 TaxID=3117021 RepID=UPI002FEFE2DA